MFSETPLNKRQTQNATNIHGRPGDQHSYPIGKIDYSELDPNSIDINQSADAASIVSGTLRFQMNQKSQNNENKETNSFSDSDSSLQNESIAGETNNDLNNSYGFSSDSFSESEDNFGNHQNSIVAMRNIHNSHATSSQQSSGTPDSSFLSSFTTNSRLFHLTPMRIKPRFGRFIGSPQRTPVQFTSKLFFLTLKEGSIYIEHIL